MPINHPFPKLFVFAHYSEAEPFLKNFSPKHLFDIKNIQFLQSEKHNIYFLISGMGSIQTSVAISIFFEKFAFLKNNILCFNIGIAGSFNQPLHSIFYASKISNYHHGKIFYPDIFINTRYAELISIEFPADKKIMQPYPQSLFDMEGFAFASALKFFVQNHQIHCIKFISDNDGIIKDTERMMESYYLQSAHIIDWINTISHIHQKYFQKHNEFSIIEEITQKLSATESQKQQLKKAAMFYIQHSSDINQLKKIIEHSGIDSSKTKPLKNKIFREVLNTLYNV